MIFSAVLAFLCLPATLFAGQGFLLLAIVLGLLTLYIDWRMNEGL